MINPLGDRVLVKENKQEQMQTRASGIIVATEDVASRHKEGEVIAVGPGRLAVDGPFHEYIPITLKVGDKVIFDYGQEYVIHSEKYYILKESEILATITK